MSLQELLNAAITINSTTFKGIAQGNDELVFVGSKTETRLLKLGKGLSA